MKCLQCEIKILLQELCEKTHTLDEALSENSVLKQTVLELEKEIDDLSDRQAYLLQHIHQLYKLNDSLIAQRDALQARNRQII